MQLHRGKQTYWGHSVARKHSVTQGTVIHIGDMHSHREQAVTQQYSVTQAACIHKGNRQSHGGHAVTHRKTGRQGTSRNIREGRRTDEREAQTEHKGHTHRDLSTENRKVQKGQQELTEGQAGPQRSGL